MPNTKSAIRALRQNIRRRETNRAKKKELKAVIKNYKKAAGEKGDEGGEKLKLVYKKLDKAARIGLIKKNKAARLKSRLTKKNKSE